MDGAKTKEKPNRSLLEGTPKGLPALQLAQRYGEIASTVGFDWKNGKKVMLKVREELRELEIEIQKKSPDGIEEELGDLLFTLASLARHCQIDAEASLRKAAGKFQLRIETMEKEKRKLGKNLSDCTIVELEEAWNMAKTATKKIPVRSKRI